MGLGIWADALACLKAQRFVHKCPDSLNIKNGMKSSFWQLFKFVIMALNHGIMG